MNITLQGVGQWKIDLKSQGQLELTQRVDLLTTSCTYVRLYKDTLATLLRTRIKEIIQGNVLLKEPSHITRENEALIR